MTDIQRAQEIIRRLLTVLPDGDYVRRKDCWDLLDVRAKEAISAVRREAEHWLATTSEQSECPATPLTIEEIEGALIERMQQPSLLRITIQDIARSTHHDR